MGFRLFQIKIVADDRPNDDGRWIERVVPDEWPGDDKASPHMLRAVPGYDTDVVPGFHVVQVTEVEPGPPDQPGTMHEMTGWPASDFDTPQPSGFGMSRG